jgi:NTP pyrophosphatase (non-canonical NTP hydrolase)
MDVWATIDDGFTAYQEQAQRTARTEMIFRDRLAVAALGLVGEAAEVSEAVKKHLGHGHDLDTLAMLEELGDVLWYIAEMTTILGAELGVVAGMNVAKLRARYPGGFSEEASRER